MRSAHKAQQAEKELEKIEPLKVGDFIVTSKHSETDCPFGVAKVLELKGTHHIECQWYGNYPKTEAKKAFLPKWVDGKDEKHYPSRKPRHHSHRAYTSYDTQLDVSTRDIIVYGNSILTSEGKIEIPIRSKIEEEFGAILWK